MRKLNSKLVMNFISEQGNDPIEKTYVACTPLDNYMCIAVAESYDNEVEENSAKLAVEAVLAAFERKPSLKRIREYIKYANEQMLLHSTRSQWKVSITVVVTDYTRMRYATCGNTRLFVLYENLFTLVSNTQTKYQQLLDADAGKKPDSSEIHNLTEYLGREKHVKPFISKKINLKEGSSLLFATSNLWGRISDVEILDAFENAKTNEELLDGLQELLLSQQDQDNQKIGSFTAAVLSIEKTFKEDVQKKKKRKKRIIMISAIILAVLLIFCIALLWIRAMDRKKIKEIEKLNQKGVQYINYENYAKSLEEFEEAAELADKLSLNNWQYIEKKKQWKDTVSDRAALLAMVQDGETALSAKNYEQAEKIYTQIQKQASYQGLDSLSDYAKKKLKEIRLRMEISQLVTLGDMYASTEDNKEALEKYTEALKLLNQVTDLETQGDVQAKIYDIRQKQKEAKQTEQEAKKAEQEAQEEEKQEKADKNIVRLNALIASANKALGEGRIPRAKELYQEILSLYNQFAGSGEDADKIFEDITALGQAITEAEVKEEEEARESQLNQAAKYVLKAKEAAKKKEIKKAKKLYNKALKIYQKLDIWDERVEEIYEAIEELEQGGTQEETPTPESESDNSATAKLNAFG